jgi:hypothetical protein
MLITLSIPTRTAVIMVCIEWDRGNGQAQDSNR